MTDHDGHTIDVGPVTVGKTLPKAINIDALQEVDRLRAENAALAAALEDIAGMLPTTTPSGFTVWIADAECFRLDDNLCHVAYPMVPGGWCSACVAEVAWCAWKMGVLGA